MPAPRRQREARPAKSEPRAALDRPRVIATATSMLRQEGIESLTLRRLADRLEVTPMALYRHVEDKDDLLSGVLSELIETRLFPERTRRWDTYLRRYAAGLRELLLEQRVLVRSILRSRNLRLPAIDAMEEALSILDRAGFTPTEAAKVFTSLNAFTIGSTLWQTMREEEEEASGSESETAEFGRYWVLDFDRLDPERFPALRRHARALEARTFEREYEEGIERILREARGRLEGRSR